MSGELDETPKKYFIVDRSEGDADSETNKAIRGAALAEARTLLDTLGDEVDRTFTSDGIEGNQIRVQVDGDRITICRGVQYGIDGYAYETASMTISLISGEILTEIDPEQDTAPLLQDALALVMLARQLSRRLQLK